MILSQKYIDLICAASREMNGDIPVASREMNGDISVASREMNVVITRNGTPHTYGMGLVLITGS